MKDEIKEILDRIERIYRKEYIAKENKELLDETLKLTELWLKEKEKIRKAIKYIKNDMPYLEEPDDDYENNHKMVEYDNSVLLNILQGSDE